MTDPALPLEQSAALSTGETELRRDARDPALVRVFLAHLERSGRLERAAAERAAQAQRESRQRVDTVLAELGLIPAPALLQATAEFFRIPLVDSKAFPGEPVACDTLSPEFLARNCVLPLEVRNGSMAVAIGDAFNTDLLSTIGFFADMRVEERLAPAAEIEAAIARLYARDGGGTENAGEVRDVGAHNEEDLQRLKDVASEAPVVRLVNRIMTNAVAQRASDIHIEPLIDGVRVRYRIDGMLQEVERLPPELQSGVATRIKILAKLNIAERRLPQDGRSLVVSGGREIDLRVSTTPVMHGENIVLRILDREQVDLSYSALGFSADLRAHFTDLLARPHGIVLVTGPTGSGKTTTLYTALRQLNTVERKVFTVEDPIEYQLPGVSQIQVRPAIGLDFVHCLRAILRQDPDVIMVGEVRDVETARIAVQASLTGHLVLATLHTNSAAAAVTRLLDMGVEDYLLASTLTGVLAQRLVRRLCEACAAPDDCEEALPVPMRAMLSPATTLAPRRPVGCETCGGSGYRGRMTIAELLVVSDPIRGKIARGISEQEIDAVARGQGMRSLFADGLMKVAAGQTTLDEVLRVSKS